MAPNRADVMSSDVQASVAVSPVTEPVSDPVAAPVSNTVTEAVVAVVSDVIGVNANCVYLVMMMNGRFVNDWGETFQDRDRHRDRYGHRFDHGLFAPFEHIVHDELLRDFLFHAASHSNIEMDGISISARALGL